MDKDKIYAWIFRAVILGGYTVNSYFQDKDLSHIDTVIKHLIK